MTRLDPTTFLLISEFQASDDLLIRFVTAPATGKGRGGHIVDKAPAPQSSATASARSKIFFGTGHSTKAEGPPGPLPPPPNAGASDSARCRRARIPPSRLPTPTRKLSVIRRNVSSTSARDVSMARREGGLECGDGESRSCTYGLSSSGPFSSSSGAVSYPPLRGARESMALTNAERSSSSVAVTVLRI
ncbi:hypothetical protein BS47DRAFT_348507 [Hydnum rufescens UP504]|uniref:Uncharacterized protein n=1 Tax=Hydnum rufescens UP504 TaxID=1448309 RepID=A0A9P6AKP4_9AGAM|nr:hypothetical protein BS47DRAFT_348507 [Hydnum rufescens UP504]